MRKLLNDEIKTRSRRNVVKSRLFSELLESSIRKYQNRAIQAAQVIEELIGLAKQMREEAAKGAELGLSDDEVAFYDALACIIHEVAESGGWWPDCAAKMFIAA